MYIGLASSSRSIYATTPQPDRKTLAFTHQVNGSIYGFFIGFRLGLQNRFAVESDGIGVEIGFLTNERH
ncbi:MAG: hypothetical protein VB124_05560 [Burkholderia sp.]